MVTTYELTVSDSFQQVSSGTHYFTNAVRSIAPRDELGSLAWSGIVGALGLEEYEVALFIIGVCAPTFICTSLLERLCALMDISRIQ